MLFDIIGLVNLFRQAGMRISNSEIEDFAQALSIAGTEREGYICALEATLIKDASQREKALRILQLFLNDSKKKLVKTNTVKSMPKSARLDKSLFYKRLEDLKNYIRAEKMRLAEETAGGGACAGGAGIMSGRYSSLFGAGENSPGEKFAAIITGGQEEDMRLAAREAIDKMGAKACRESSFFQKIRLAPGWAEGEEMLRKLAKSGAGPDIWTVEERLNSFQSIVAEERDRALWRKDPVIVLKNYDRSAISFNRMDYDEAVEIKRKLLMLGRRLATKKGYRYTAARRGTVDLRRTAALAGTYGGIPVKLLMKDRTPTKPEIVIICDLSGSVSSFSRFMMLLVSAMQDKFRSVRSFAFVDGIEEITGLLKGWDAEKKIARILRETNIWKTGFSDYGLVWQLFWESFAPSVTRRTTLIILGDARNNYKPDGLGYFTRIAERARRVLWLNPYPTSEWDSEDSIISRYAKYCHSVVECSNLMQLERAAVRIFN